MSFTNRIRLPFKLTRPQFPEEREAIRKANGETKTLSVIVRKVYEGETDWWPEKWHERFKIALAHDSVTIEGDKYVGVIAQDGDYNIEWQEFLDYPTAKGAFKAEVTPFNNSNSNCQTCEEAAQVSLENDMFSGELEPDQDYEHSLADNDTICCYPAAFSLVSFNTDYLDSATIDPATGVLSIHTKATYTDANELVIATYRVTCPNGGYDEATVSASFTGSEAGCLAPTGLALGITTTTSATYSWNAPTAGTLDYYWEIYEGSSPVGTPVQTGTSTTDDPTLGIVITGLDANTEYYFQVRTTCSESDSSNFIGTGTDTPVETETCGSYEVAMDDGTGVPSNSRIVKYRDCNGVISNAVVFNMSSVIVCAYQSSPGSPALISASSAITVTYLGLC